MRLQLQGPDGPETVTAAYVVGTDGAHSAVRRLIGVDFVGEQYATHIMLADVRLARPPGETLFGATTTEGLVLFVPFGDGWFRAIAWDRTREEVPLAEPVTFDELRGAFRRIAGDDFGMERAALEHPVPQRAPPGAQLPQGAGVPRGRRRPRALPRRRPGHEHRHRGRHEPRLEARRGRARLGRPGLLDTYEQERHPVGEMVLRMTDGAYKLVMARTRVGLKLRQQAIRLMLRVPRARRRIAGLLSGIDIHYARPAGAHPWVGRRMPDLTGVGGERLYEALRAGRFVLVGDVTSPGCGLVRPGGCVHCAPQEKLPGTRSSSVPTATWTGRPTRRRRPRSTPRCGSGAGRSSPTAA